MSTWNLRMPLEQDPSLRKGAWVCRTRQARELSAVIERMHVLRLCLLLLLVVLMSAKASPAEALGFSLVLLALTIAIPACASAYLRRQITQRLALKTDQKSLLSG